MNITQQEHHWGWGLVPSKLFQLTKSGENPFPFVSQYRYISDLIWAGLELNQGEMPFVVSCALFTSYRAGMPVTAVTGAWAEAEACFLFSGSCWLCVFPKQSQLCWALQLGSTTAARSEIGPTVFGQVVLSLWFTLSPPALMIAKGSLANWESNY